jgi:hypothetical protein
LILCGTTHLSKKPIKKCHSGHSPLARAADFGSSGQRPMERMCHSLIPSPVILNYVISHVSFDFRSGGFLRDTCDLRWYRETGFSVVRQRMEIETLRQKAAISVPEYAFSDHSSRLLLSCDVSQSDSTAGNAYKQFTFAAIRSTFLTRSGSVWGLLCSPTLQRTALSSLTAISPLRAITCAVTSFRSLVLASPHNHCLKLPHRRHFKLPHRRCAKWGWFGLVR